jgi:hypothetical protein
MEQEFTKEVNIMDSLFTNSKNGRNIAAQTDESSYFFQHTFLQIVNYLCTIYRIIFGKNKALNCLINCQNTVQ